MPIHTLQLLHADDLATVRTWRNHPDVRRHMFSTHAISEAEHQQWYERQQADPLRRLWLFVTVYPFVASPVTTAVYPVGVSVSSTV